MKTTELNNRQLDNWRKDRNQIGTHKALKNKDARIAELEQQTQTMALEALVSESEWMEKLELMQHDITRYREALEEIRHQPNISRPIMINAVVEDIAEIAQKALEGE